LYVQEQWTRKPFSRCRGALRFDRSTSWYPEADRGDRRGFLPVAHPHSPHRRRQTRTRDLTAARPARSVGLSFGQRQGPPVKAKHRQSYLEGAGVVEQHGRTRNPTTAGAPAAAVRSRPFERDPILDRPRNSNFRRGTCDLLNPSAQGIARTSGGGRVAARSRTRASR